MSVVKINNLGKFTYNYIIDPKKKYNVLSACLFKASDVSNFSRYVGNILKFKEFEKKIINEKFFFRLYYDDSILEDTYVKKNWSKINEYFQLVHYDCPKFKNKNGKHNGTFGTLMRFLPFHDFPENDVNLCFVIDVDNIENKYRKLNILIKLMNENKLDLIFTYWYCHTPSHTINKENFILANLLIKIKLPLHYLVNYVNYGMDNLFKKYKELKDKITSSTNKKYNHKFFYGIDEIYLELYLNFYIKTNKIKYGRYAYAHYLNLKTLLDNMFKELDDTTKINKIIVSLNKKFDTNYKDIFDFINIFEDYDYDRKTNMHEKYEYFHKKIIKLYTQNPDLKKPKNYKCFERIPKFFDETNNLEIYN